jgi:hypothetical protein
MELKIKARELGLSTTLTPSNFVLKNAGKLAPDLLKEVAAYLHYASILKTKVPTWFENGQTLAPSSLNIEQSSSEHTARYKAEIFSGGTGADLSGGMGVDSYFLAQKAEKWIHNEPSHALSALVAYNFGVLGLQNTQFTQYLAEDFPLEELDFIYVDPSRRDEYHNKVFLPQDCQPNLPKLREKLLAVCPRMLIKYAPLLDIKAAFQALVSVEEMWVLAEKNEVKELLFSVGRNGNPNPPIHCINLQTSQSTFTFSFEEERHSEPLFHAPKRYLYEPNAAIMKAGAFSSVATQFSLEKLARNSHLYTSNTLVSNFPGRILEVEDVTNFDKKSLNTKVKGNKANVIVRNFPLKPEEIKKKLGWKDGGEHYIYFTTSASNQKLCIITKKISL